ncbi:Exportin-6 [Dinochytrium kinnereticum]|nr:Exportin-6 [Dinochytrium kinnereticum]
MCSTFSLRLNESALIHFIRFPQDEASVVSIVTEYFTQSTSQPRKRDIAFDKAVRQWHRIPPQDRVSHRQFLWGLLTHRHLLYKPFVLNTLIKTLVHIGASDYPNEWPAFFQDIYDFRTSALQLTLLLIKVVIEEFTSDRHGVSSSKKSQLRLTLVQQSSTVIPFITEILTGLYDTCIADPAHPFSSPTEKGGASIGIGLHSPLNTSSQWQLPIVGDSPSRNVLAGMGGHGLGGVPVSSGQLDREATEVCSLSFNILLQLFSWIPLSENAVPAVDVVLRYCQLCDDQTVELGTAAMSVVNEILSRNFVPNGVLSFVLSIARQTCLLLRRITDEGVKGTGKLELDEKYYLLIQLWLMTTYQSKFTDFLNCFVSHHIQRGENIPDFPIGEFLQLFYRYTFLQGHPEGFQQCLNVWDTFLEYLIAQRSLSSSDGAHLANSYESGLVILAKDTLSKILMTENPKELSSITFNRDETEGLSEWEKFSQPCIDLIVKITELYPSDLLSVFFNLLVNFSDRLLAMNPNASKKVERRSVVQDLSTIVRLFGQLSIQFTNNFAVSIVSAYTLLYKFTDILNFCLGKMADATVPESILSLYLFGTLKLYIHWIELYYSHSQSSPDDMKQCKDLLNRFIELSLSSLSLKSEIPDLPQETTQNLYMAVTLACLFPQTENRVSDQEWKSRHQSFLSFSGDLVGSFKSTISIIEQNPASSSDVNTKRHIKNLLLVFLSMIDAVAGGNSNSKEVVAAGLQDVLNLYSPLLNIFRFDPEIFESFLDFSLSALKSLKRQIARDFFHIVTDTLQVFFKIMQSNAFLPLLAKESGSSLLDKFVMFLACIVEESSKSFETLLPDIVGFVASEMFGRLLTIQNPKVDSVKAHYYVLLFKAIMCHQQYFFGSQVKHLAGRQGSDVAHDEELLGLLKALGAAFMDPNVEVFKQALELFEGLNNKCLLFTRRIVQENFLVFFGDMLLGILIRRSHDFLKEEIVICLSKVFLCGNDHVKGEMIPFFIKNHCGMLNGEQQSVLAGYITAIKDQSNVNEMIEALVSDYTFFLNVGGP